MAVASTVTGRHCDGRRRSHLVVVVAVVALVALASPLAPVAGSAPLQDGPTIRELQREREEVRRRKAATASSVDALKASDAEVAGALAVLSSNVSIQRDRVEEAERSVARSVADEAAALNAQAERQRELDVLSVQMRDSAVEAYVATTSGGSFVGVGADDVNDVVQRTALVGVRVNQDLALAERYRSVQEDLEFQRAAAAAAAEAARTNKLAVERQLVELTAAVQEQQVFAAQVEQRLDRALAEADSLASIDTQLASTINARQIEIATAVEAQRAEQAVRAARNAASRASAVATAARAPRPSEIRRPSTNQPPAPARPAASPTGNGGGAPPPITGGGEIVSVGGIRVHASIAGNVQALLAAASAAGIRFSGGGYRDPAGQIAVRRNNCGSSNYAIYQMPSSSCRPPTARPGSSMHERGLAIDFTQGGRTLTRSSPAFAWLRANAARFGLRNLPSEPWHWSTNGN